MTSNSRTLVFAGDSITDAGRREDPDRLGDGYVRVIAERLSAGALDVVNVGISGDRVVDLRRRWADDVLEHRADVLTVMIGVNDTWRRYDSDDATTAADFGSVYDEILESASSGGVQTLILMEPFLVPIDDAQRAWREEDLDAKIEVTRSLAAKYGAVLVPLDSLLNEAAKERTAAEIASDGVHPTALGHRLIADEWWTAAASVLEEQLA